MDLQELTEQVRAGRVAALNLISLEGGFYFLEVETAEKLHRLADAHGRTLMLRSVEHARDVLEEVPDVPFHLVHASPYDEMCGLASGRREPLKVPLALRSAWGRR